MNLYCILKGYDDQQVNSLRRVQLSQALQDLLNNFIKQIITEMLNKNQIIFSGDYKAEEDEVLVIRNFQNNFVNLNPLSIQNLNEEDIENIKAIVFFDNNIMAFQCFDNRKLIKPEKWYLIYSGNTYSKIDNKGLIIDNKIDVLFYQNNLFFYSYHNASKIFDLTEYYREATDSEINAFLSNNLFIVDGQPDREIINTRTRKKLYLIIKNQILNRVIDNFNEVSKYAEEVGLNNIFDTKKQKIRLPTEKKHFEMLIRFLNEDLFKTPITNSIYETNSKKVISI